MIENKDIEHILEILENLEDEELAVSLLKEFNQASAELGKLLLNQDQALSHEEWKKLCDQAQARLSKVIETIERN